MHRFYIPGITGDICTLDEEESKHCVRVLRLKENDAVEITDGKGNLFEAVIQNANPKACVLHIEAQNFEPLDWELIIAVAPTKNLVRMEWLIEKLTEIGFTKFIPVLCHNSERKVLKTERLKRIALESMKQSGRVYLPKIEEMISFNKLIETSKLFKGQKIIPHCHFDTERKSLHSVYNKSENALVLIGPEGDFTNEEIELAVDKGFTPVTLNNHTLRTETAALFSAISLKTLHF